MIILNFILRSTPNIPKIDQSSPNKLVRNFLKQYKGNIDIKMVEKEIINDIEEIEKNSKIELFETKLPSLWELINLKNK